jgi:hypothetical protein
MSRINIKISPGDHQKLKIVTAIAEISIKEFVLSAIREKVGYEISKIPNEETLAAFKETDTGVGLIKHNSLARLLEDLGLNK